ncbi:MAG TPA: hypothetical protein VFV42_03265, partial [Acidimicrobiales bacterium]|nr:hypothetical protein [Acidimicrobiales bacterium]
AGWALPVIPAADGWTDELEAGAGRVVGAPVRAVRELEPGVWEVEPLGRVPAVGVTWVGLDEVGRLGVDAPAVRRWAALGEDRSPDG